MSTYITAEDVRQIIREELAAIHSVPTVQPAEMDLQQAATYLGISTSTLYKHLANGTISGTKRGKAWRFTLTDLQAYQAGTGREGAHEQ